MRQVLAIVAAAVLAAGGAVVIGEYDLEGVTVILGFPLYGVAVTELAVAVAKRLALPTLVATAAIVAAGLTWALWISFGHFRNDVYPSPLAWAMVAIAAVGSLGWGRPSRRRRRADGAGVEPRGDTGTGPGAGIGSRRSGPPEGEVRR